MESEGKTATGGPYKTGQKLAELERAVRESHERSIQAILNHDPEAVRQEFSAGFRSAGGDFQFKSRDGLARRLRSGKLKYRSIQNDDDTTVKFATPSVAVVTGRRTVEAVIDGKPFASNFHNTAVYVLENGRWKVLLWAVDC